MFDESDPLPPVYTRQQREDAAWICAVLASTPDPDDGGLDRDVVDSDGGIAWYVEVESWPGDTPELEVAAKLATAAYSHAIDLVPLDGNSNRTRDVFEARTNALAESMIRSGWSPGDVDEGLELEEEP